MIIFPFEFPYKISFDICGFLVGIFALAYFNQLHHTKRSQHRIFLSLIFFMLSAAVGNVGGEFCHVLSSYYGTKLAFAANIFITIYFISNLFLTASLVLYIDCVCGFLMDKGKSFYILYNFPNLICLVLIFLNFSDHRLFGYDANCNYFRGPFISLLYIPLFFYVAHAVISFIRNRHSLSQKKLGYFFHCIVFSLAGFTIQILIPALQVQLFAEALTALAFLMTFENNEKEIDAETNLFNSEVFFQDYETALSLNSDFTIVAVNVVDSSKEIAFWTKPDRDTLYRGIALRLNRIAEGKKLYRYDRDKFMILFPKKESGEENDRTISDIIDSFYDDFAKPIKVGEKRQPVNLLVTIASLRDDLDEIPVEDLFHLDGAIDFGQKNIYIRQKQDLIFIHRNARICAAIKRSCENKTFKVYYKPLWSTESHKIVAAKAVARSDEPGLEYVQLEELFKIAREYGMIFELEKLLFEEVCSFYAGFKPYKNGIESITMSISPYPLSAVDIVHTFRRIAEEYKVPPSFLNIELLENEDSLEKERFMTNIELLKQLGFSFFSASDVKVGLTDSLPDGGAITPLSEESFMQYISNTSAEASLAELSDYDDEADLEPI